MTFIAGVFLALIGFALAATLIIFAVGPIMVLNPRRRGEDFYKERGEPLSPADYHLSYEEIWFTNRDNQRLHAWFIPAEEPVQEQSSICTASATTRSADCGWHMSFIYGIST